MNDIFNWAGSGYFDKYTKWRPPYTEAFYRIIFDYHQSHGGKLHAVHDAGTGNGIVAQRLAFSFERVLASDPVEGVLIGTTQQFKARPHADRMTFAVHPAEQMHTWIDPGSLDMVVMAEAVHWTEPDQVIASAAKVLRPGGSLAIWCYGLNLKFLDGGVAAEMGHVLGEIERRAMELGASRAAREKADLVIGSQLDLIAVSKPDGQFGNEVRWKWENEHQFLPEGIQVKEWTPAFDASQVTVKHAEIFRCWDLEADIDWFKGYIDTIAGVNKPCGSEFDALWTKLEGLLGDQKARIAFPATLILATRQ